MATAVLATDETAVERVRGDASAAHAVEARSQAVTRSVAKVTSEDLCWRAKRRKDTSHVSGMFRLVSYGFHPDFPVSALPYAVSPLKKSAAPTPARIVRERDLFRQLLGFGEVDDVRPFVASAMTCSSR